MSAAEEIFDLLETNGQSGSDMTQALKALGGDMKSGLKKIGEFFFDEGMSKGYQAGMDVGEKNGLLKGSAITLGLVALVQGGIYLYGKHKQKKELTAQEKAHKEIADTIKSAITPIEEDTPTPQPVVAENSVDASEEGTE